ncbi:MAG: caspase family protein [Rhodobacteraceae bacterium]|nr:caspase family protein [Paracoccaceae bacterium]
MRGVLCALILWLAAALPGAAERVNHALLIGVDRYPALDERFWLRGPSNDVALARDFLLTAAPVPFRPADVVVLSDGIEGAELPTLANILAAFAALQARVAPGDFVYLHFSGHGAQAPARFPETEIDGMDELFLPMDVAGWRGPADLGSGGVVNALVDDDIGALLDALRAAGADVWAVFDACHSGTMTRAVTLPDAQIRTRQVTADALGIPAAAIRAAQARAMPPAAAPLPDAPLPAAPLPDAPVPAAPLDAAPLDAATGSLVAFFAAQSHEVTEEMPLPRTTLERTQYGVFTWTLFETLAEFPGASYARVAEEVMRRYATRTHSRATPLFHGPLDTMVFGGDAAEPVVQWAVVADASGGFDLPAGGFRPAGGGVAGAGGGGVAGDTAHGGGRRRRGAGPCPRDPRRHVQRPRRGGRGGGRPAALGRPAAAGGCAGLHRERGAARARSARGRGGSGRRRGRGAHRLCPRRCPRCRPASGRAARQPAPRCALAVARQRLGGGFRADPVNRHRRQARLGTGRRSGRNPGRRGARCEHDETGRHPAPVRAARRGGALRPPRCHRRAATRRPARGVARGPGR